MKITVKSGSITDQKGDVLIVNLFQDVKEPSGATGAVDKALEGLISKELIGIDEFKGKLGSCGVIATYGKLPVRKIVVVGLGKKEEFDINAIRKASACALKVCNRLKAEKVYSVLHGAGACGLSAELCSRALAEGTILANYKFDKYKSKKQNGNSEEENNKKELKKFTIIELDESKINDIKKGIETGEIIANATNFARDLVTEQASIMTPAQLAEEAKSIGLKCKIYEKEEIEEMKMGSFLGVARGSVNPPKFIHLKYKPEKKAKKKIAIVGKGITFDSGGLDLKPAAGMVDMKMDMSGAAATLGIMKAVKDLKPEYEIDGIIPACENMPDGNAYKPGDVLTAKNGKTIEVQNTDAEGRLILADALCFAVEQKPDEIIDIATLTGAVVIALGKSCAGIMGNRQDMIEDFIEASEPSGERVWQLPLLEDYKEFLKSDIADIINSGSREAGSSFGGIFLQEFVKDTPWIHLDIAGTASSSKDKFEIPKGYTGFGVRCVSYYLLS